MTKKSMKRWVEEFGLMEAHQASTSQMAAEANRLQYELHQLRLLQLQDPIDAIESKAIAEKGRKSALKQRLKNWILGVGSVPSTEDESDRSPGLVGDHEDGPTVSIVVTFYNQDQTALDGLVSLLDQTFVDFEMVLVDDGSSRSDTADLIMAVKEAFTGRRVQHHQQTNSGVCAARNTGLNYARGKYVAFFDPGDQWSETYLEKAVALLEQYWDVHVVYPYVRNFGGSEPYWCPETANESILELRNSVPVCALVRRSALVRVGGFDQRMADGFEDWELWLRLAKAGANFRVIPEPLFHYQFSDLSGRDAHARLKFKILHDRLLSMNAVSQSQLKEVENGDFETELSGLHRTFSSGSKGVVVFFLPWLLEHGGADVYARSLLRLFKASGWSPIVVSTEILSGPKGFDLYASLTPYVYQLEAVADVHRSSFIRSLLIACNNPLVINFGSPWLYRNCWQGFRPHVNSAIDVHFNHVGHLGELSLSRDFFDAVVCASDGLKQIVESLGLVDEDKVKVRTIYVGIDPLPFTRDSGNSGMAMRKKVGWIGRFSAEKNPEFFCRMAEALTDCKLQMLGDGALLPDLRRRYSDLVDFAASSTPTEDFLSDLSVLVISSDVEGIPLVALEALSAGIPVVSRAAGALEELAEICPDGLRVVPKTASETEVAHIVAGVLDETSHSTARHGRESLIPDEMTWDYCAREWLSLLNDLRRVPS